MITIKKNGNTFIVEWEGMDIEFNELRKALIFVETVFKFIAMDVKFEEILAKANSFDEIMERNKKCDVMPARY